MSSAISRHVRDALRPPAARQKPAKARKAATPEGALKAAVLEALKPLEAAKRIKIIRQQSGTRGGGKMRLAPKGTPDIQVLVRGGRSVWLEAKRPDGKGKRASTDATRIAQEAWRADAEALDHVVHIIESVQDALTAVLEGAR